MNIAFAIGNSGTYVIKPVFDRISHAVKPWADLLNFLPFIFISNSVGFVPDGIFIWQTSTRDP